MSPFTGLFPVFLGALQASLAVLLTILFGTVAARFNLLKEASCRDISKVCVRLFLPALLITSVGSELHAGTAGKYVPVLAWSLVYTLASMGLGWVLKRAFKWPAWTVPASKLFCVMVDVDAARWRNIESWSTTLIRKHEFIGNVYNCQTCGHVEHEAVLEFS